MKNALETIRLECLNMQTTIHVAHDSGELSELPDILENLYRWEHLAALAAGNPSYRVSDCLEVCPEYRDTIGLGDPGYPIVTDVCPDSPNGKHEPSWRSIDTQWDGDECYVDVNCVHCGASGCIGTSATLAEGINW